MLEKLKFVISYFVNLCVLGGAFYVDEFRTLPLEWQVVLIASVAAIQSATGSTIEYIKEKAANAALRTRAQDLELLEKGTRRELDEFREVVVSFLEYSELYREKVKDRLQLVEDCLCVVKSSEGLSQVFQEMEKKEMLPFGSVLSRIPGSVKPFERQGVFLVPVSSLPGIAEGNVRTYMAKKIIPKVESERANFLSRLPSSIARKAEPLSYKYIAFLLRRGAIAYDTENRKFNREFVAFIISQQSRSSMANLKRELQDIVRTKELLALVNWSTFVNLNREQAGLIEAVQLKLATALDSASIGTLSSLSKSTIENLQKAIWPVVRRRTTKRKAKNLSKKIIEGARHTVEVLQRYGVML